MNNNNVNLHDGRTIYKEDLLKDKSTDRKSLFKRKSFWMFACFIVIILMLVALLTAYIKITGILGELTYSHQRATSNIEQNQKYAREQITNIMSGKGL